VAAGGAGTPPKIFLLQVSPSGNGKFFVASSFLFWGGAAFGIGSYNSEVSQCYRERNQCTIETDFTLTSLIIDRHYNALVSGFKIFKVLALFYNNSAIHRDLAVTIIQTFLQAFPGQEHLHGHSRYNVHAHRRLLTIVAPTHQLQAEGMQC